MIRHPPSSPLFPTRRSSDLVWIEVVVRVPMGRRDVLDAVGRLDDVGPELPQVARLGVQAREAHDRDRGAGQPPVELVVLVCAQDRKSTRLNSSHPSISYAVF